MIQKKTELSNKSDNEKIVKRWITRFIITWTNFSGTVISKVMIWNSEYQKDDRKAKSDKIFDNNRHTVFGTLRVKAAINIWLQFIKLKPIIYTYMQV